MTKPTAPFQFEAALNDLESIVEKMENQTLSLEESLQQFEQGIGLIKACQQALTEAEQKVKIIQAL